MRSSVTTLSGKVALVTGASRGIGHACAIKLGALGIRIAVNYNKSVTAADDVVARIKAGGGEATAVQGDVSDFATAQAVVKSAIAAYGRLDILVNNAGTTRDGLLATMKEEDFDVIIQQNLKSVFNCNRAASDIFSGVQGGSQTTSTLTLFTPGTARILASTSGGSDPATGQAGDVRVMRTFTSPDASFTSTS